MSIACLANAAVIAPSPGQEVETLGEFALVVFDPLTGTETVVVQHTFAGTSRPFGIIIPTPAPAKVAIQPERLIRSIQQKLHPPGPERSTLEVHFTSWVGDCAVRRIGDTQPETGNSSTNVQIETMVTPVGSAPEPLHDWLLKNALTISPAQVAWIRDLRDKGYSFHAILIRPKDEGKAPASRLKGPVIALTHATEEPVYTAGHPPFSLDLTGQAPPLEIAVLTEWAVRLDALIPEPPYFADTLSGSDVAHLGLESQSPWPFRRAGSLTAFLLNRTATTPVLHFAQVDPLPPKRPTPTPRIRPHHLRLPVEALLLGFVLGIYGLIRFWRSGKKQNKLQG